MAVDGLHGFCNSGHRGCKEKVRLILPDFESDVRIRSVLPVIFHRIGDLRLEIGDTCRMGRVS